MTYETAVSQMIKLWNEAKKETSKLYSKEFSPYPGIKIKYPGRKKAGDYILYDEKTMDETPRHSHYCQMLYEYICKHRDMFDIVVYYLEIMYCCGIADDPAYYRNLPKELVDLLYRIFWVTLQEDINYPARDTNKYRGRQLPFWRYFEAICAAYYTNPEKNIDSVKYLADRRDGVYAELWKNICKTPIFYSKDVRPIMNK